MVGLKTLGERAKAAREHLGLTQSDIAEAVGISQPTLWALEEGKSKGTRYLVKLAAALKQTPEWLSLGVGEMLRHDQAQNVRTGIKLVTLDMSQFRKRHVKVIGTVQAGLQPKREISRADEEMLIMFAEPKYGEADIFALRQGDRSANRIVPAGATLAVVPIHQLPTPLQPGDHVIVRREPGGNAQGMQELLCMLFIADGDGDFRLVLDTVERDFSHVEDIEVDANCVPKSQKKGEKITVEYCVIEVTTFMRR